MPRTRKGLVLFWTALFMLSVALQYASAMAPRGALAQEVATAECESYAIFTSTEAGDVNNENFYDSKPEVWLNGGPATAGGNLTAGTVFYYRVEEPDGTPLSEIRSVTVGATGRFLVSLAPFATTTNPGGSYNVTVSSFSDLHQGGGCTKNDHFKVADQGSLKVTKTVNGGPAGFSGSFPISIDCGTGGVHTGTIVFPTPGFITFTGLDAKASCTVTEGPLPAVPAGFTWGTPSYTGNPAVIVSGQQVTAGVVNTLNVIPAPAFTVDKGVSTSAAGPFVGNLSVGTGTLLQYRITITNTGNVALTGVTLSDNTYNLVTKGCVIPISLAVGAHYDCNYTATAVSGTTTNIATGDTDQTGPDSGTATVVASDVPVPGFTVDKGVSLNAAGPFGPSLTVATGTTVHYRITITNTGNVALTGVTLADNTYDLVAKGCAVPTSLAIGATYDCNYSAVAVTGTTTNVATGDTTQTPPDTGTATLVASPNPTLTIDKTNNAALSNGLPTATEGTTVTFTLAYSHTGDSVSDGIITDVLPDGLTYVAGTATSNGEFSFDRYVPGTRTLTWTADEDVTESGTLSYQAKVDVGAAEEEQPLENEATIDSDDTAPDSDVSDVFVPAPVQAETNVPTAPRTDTLGSTDNTTAGFSLLLVLLALAGLAFSIVMVTPMPKSIRNRSGRR